MSTHSICFQGEIKKNNYLEGLLISTHHLCSCLFVTVLRSLRPSQPNRFMSNAVSLPNHSSTGQFI